jgi:hypothetical protein
MINMNKNAVKGLGTSFYPLMHQGRQLVFPEGLDSVTLIFKKNQPDQKNWQLDMRYKVNKEFGKGFSLPKNFQKLKNE